MSKLLKASVVILLIVVGVPVFLSWFARGWVAKYDSPEYSFKHIPDLTGKVAIVTGGNTGIGKVTVRELAAKGARVILSSRSMDKGNQAKKDICEAIAPLACKVDVLQLDLSSLASVKAFADAFKATSAGGVPQLDMLILNAGVMACPYTETVDGYEMQFGTNHLGHFFLTEQLMPVLEEWHGRVVTVASNAHEGSYSGGIRFNQFKSNEGYDMILAYGQSKLANILFSNELARRVQASGSGVTANCLHPGFITTDLMRHVDTQIQGLGDVLAQVLSLGTKWVFSAAMDADTGALTQLYVATAPELKGVSGKYFQPIAKETTPNALARDVGLQKRLWEESERITRAFINR